MIYLQSNRLRVEVCEPKEAPNTTYRFDRAGFVSEVTLDGNTRFCATEPNNLWHPSSGGRGLCSEILFDVSDQFEVGEAFPKLGVGLLKKNENAPYCFYKKYEAELFPVTADTTTSSAVFKTAAIPIRGYAVEQIKRVEVHENQLNFTMQITNVGDKTLHIREYCHNFFSIGGMAIGEAYRIDLPCVDGIPQGDMKSSEGLDNYIGTTSGIQIRSYSDQYATIKFQPSQFKKEQLFCWKMSNTAAKASISCEESFLPGDLAVWCVDHMVSPEVFHDIILHCGETEMWQRSYSFESELT